MKRFGIVMAAMMLAISVTGCNEQNKENSAVTTAVSATENSSGELVVNTEEGFDEDYANALKAYFSAIEKQDFAAYKAAIYPPFYEKLEAYYKEKSKTMEEVLAGIHKQFDEDGYDGWKLTRISAAVYRNSQGVSSENDTLDFLNAFKSSNMIDDAFIEETQKAAKDMKNIKFSVYALYTGDEEDVPAVSGREILAIKTEQGTYLFG